MRAIASLFFLAALLLAACSSGIDRSKFTDMKKDAAAIARALDSMANYGEFEKLVGELAQHVEEARPKMATEREKTLFNEYHELLIRYQDAAVFWKYKVGSYQYDWIPKGRVYVDAELRTVVAKYGFRTEQHFIQLTNHNWESVSADDLKVILEKAKEQYERVKKG